MKFSCEVICQDSIEVTPSPKGGFDVVVTVKGVDRRSWIKPCDVVAVAHMFIYGAEGKGYEGVLNNLGVQSAGVGGDERHVNISIVWPSNRVFVAITPFKALEIAHMLKSKATVESIEKEIDAGQGLTDEAVFTKDEQGNLSVAVSIDSFDGTHENTFTITAEELKSLGVTA